MRKLDITNFINAERNESGIPIDEDGRPIEVELNGISISGKTVVEITESVDNFLKGKNVKASGEDRNLKIEFKDDDFDINPKKIEIKPDEEDFEIKISKEEK